MLITLQPHEVEAALISHISYLGINIDENDVELTHQQDGSVSVELTCSANPGNNATDKTVEPNSNKGGKRRRKRRTKEQIAADKAAEAANEALVTDTPTPQATFAPQTEVENPPEVPETTSNVEALPNSESVPPAPGKSLFG